LEVQPIIRQSNGTRQQLLFDWQWCQRWRNDRDSGRTAEFDDRFQARRYQAAGISAAAACRFVVAVMPYPRWPVMIGLPV
jgi:hypothetical protein